MKFKLIIFAFLLVFITEKSQGQRIFVAYGFSVDYLDCPDFDYNYQRTNTNYLDSGNMSLSGFSVSLRLSLTYNLIKLGDNNSINLNVCPSLGVGKCSSELTPSNYPDFSGKYNFITPIFLSYRTGAGATKNSSFKRGFSFGFGYDFVIAPLIKSESIPSDVQLIGGNPIKNTWLQPCFSLGYLRYRENKQRLFEFNLKYSYNKLNSYTPGCISIGFSYSFYQKEGNIINGLKEK